MKEKREERKEKKILIITCGFLTTRNLLIFLLSFFIFLFSFACDNPVIIQLTDHLIEEEKPVEPPFDDPVVPPIDDPVDPPIEPPVLFNIVLNVTGDVTGDSVALDKTEAYNGEDITITYTLYDDPAKTTNQLTLSFVNTASFTTTTPETSSYIYTVNPQDAVNGTIIITAAFLHENIFIVTNASEWADALAAIIAGGNGTAGEIKEYVIIIDSDFDIPGSNSNTFGSMQYIKVTISGDNEISLRTGTTGNLLRVGANQTVTIQDTKLKGHSSNINMLVNINGSNAFLTMNGSSSVSGNTASFGGGVTVGNGTFIMNDNSSVSLNTISNGVGGVDVASDGIFIMNGSSSVSGNQGSFCGGVSVGGIFIMNGGTISGNTSGLYGGGVYVDNNGIFKKEATGGIIYGYNADDPVRSNVTKNVSGVIQNYMGHAVWVNSTPRNRREDTVTATEALEWDGTTSTAIGNWTSP